MGIHPKAIASQCLSSLVGLLVEKLQNSIKFLGIKKGDVKKSKEKSHVAASLFSMQK